MTSIVLGPISYQRSGPWQRCSQRGTDNPRSLATSSPHQRGMFHRALFTFTRPFVSATTVYRKLELPLCGGMLLTQRSRRRGSRPVVNFTRNVSRFARRVAVCLKSVIFRSRPNSLLFPFSELTSVWQPWTSHGSNGPAYFYPSMLISYC